jgi:hypothetical protein
MKYLVLAISFSISSYGFSLGQCLEEAKAATVEYVNELYQCDAVIAGTPHLPNYSEGFPESNEYEVNVECNESNLVIWVEVHGPFGNGSCEVADIRQI